MGKMTLPEVPSGNNIYIQDYANMFSPQTEQGMLVTARELSTKTKAQVVVVTINSLEGNDRDQYAEALFDKWKPGDSKLNNGVLILISKQDKQARIEVGRGLEGAINDAKAGDILRQELYPNFKQGKFDAGINATFNKVVAEVSKEYKTQLKTIPKPEPMSWAKIILGILAVIVIILVISYFTDGFLAGFLIGSVIDSIFGGDGGGSDFFGGGDSGGGGAGGSWD